MWWCGGCGCGGGGGGCDVVCVGVLVVVVVPTCAYNRGVCPSKLTSTSIYGDHVLVDMTPGPVPMYRDTKTNRKIPNAPAD